MFNVPITAAEVEALKEETNQFIRDVASDDTDQKLHLQGN
jgi:hypothetical protein